MARSPVKFLKFCKKLNTGSVTLNTYFVHNWNSCPLQKFYLHQVVARFSSTVNEKEASDVLTVDAEVSSKSEQDDLEIERKRNKSRIPEHIRRDVIDLVPNELKHDSQYRLSNLRYRYAKYGKASGLNPGICYPTREELESMIEYENLAHPELFSAMERLKQKKQEEAEVKRAREQLILKNMEKLPQWRQEMLDQKKKRQKEVAVHTAKKERLIEEVRDYLGYHVDVKDPKFQEMLIKKEEENKKALKVAKKKERNEKTLALILSVGDSIQKAAQDVKPPTDNEEKKNKEQ